MKLLFIICTLVLSVPADAKINVVTTLTDLAAITKEIGGDEVSVEAVAKGTQDPHFIEAKPSYMVKLHKADLVISIGLELEVGWLPGIISGARNPEIKKGQKGYLEIGPLVDVIEVPSGKMSRAEGDVHPDGNPHVTLSPKNVGKIGEIIAERLGELETSHAGEFKNRATKLKTRMETKSKGWKIRIDKSGVKNVITYHKTLNYFLDSFGLINPIDLEPKPGIPPTSKHIMAVLNVIKEKGISLILIENYFDSKIADRIKEDFPKIRIVSVPAAVEGEPEIKSMDDLFENLVKTIEGK